MRGSLLLTASLIFTVCPTGIRADDSKRDCLEDSNHDQRITACSAVIDANPNDAIAYYRRAVAYQFKGEIDRAISDYTKAIELNPRHAAAYDGRARAYASKGNYTSAVADVTMAAELGANGEQLKKVSTEVGPTKASELAPTSTPPPKAMTAEDLVKKTGPSPNSVKAVANPKVPQKQDHPAKSMASGAKEAKTVTNAAPAAKKASPEGSWPAWVPQGQSQN
jgi:tetratricopeptide (TPR) repeat protein